MPSPSVNLVDETMRPQKIEAIIAANAAPDGSRVDVIIALGMFKEGANWRWADREVIIGSRSSLTEVVQMVGQPAAIIDCFGILDDAKILRYFELDCEVKGLGRGHMKRIKDRVKK